MIRVGFFPVVVADGRCQCLTRFVRGAGFDPGARRPVPVRDWGYLASELRGSIPLSDQGANGALTIGTNFFEFVEEQESPPTPMPAATGII